MFEVSKEVPLPKVYRSKYPFGSMEKGDSFYVPGGKVGTMSANSQRYGKKLGMKFVARTEGDGCRVWRVE